jgi:hypothetical protein
MASSSSSSDLPLPWGRPSSVVVQTQGKSRVPKLVNLCLDRLANNLDTLHDVSAIRDEALCAALLHRIIARGKLTFRLARIFQQCGHADIEEALETANLFDALPGPTDPKLSHNSCGPR